MEDDDAIDVMLHNSGDTSLAGQQNKPNTTKAPLLVDPSSYNYQVPIYNPTPDLQMAGYASPRVSLSQPVSGAKSSTYQETKPNITKVPEFVDLQSYYQQDGSRTSFRAKRNIKLRELVVQYCTQHSLDMKVLRVLFDGTRLRQELTPQELGMEDGDEIEVMINANGGSRII